MRHTIGLIIGMILLVLGAQGAIRLLVDHDNGGLLRWMPGGFGVWLSCHVAATVVGVALAAWGSRKGKQVGTTG